MKTMKDYTNYCTPEQTKRAYKLGAPIESTGFPENHPNTPICRIFKNGYAYFLFQPTTQQMVGWLREEHNLCCYADINYNEKEYDDRKTCGYMFYKFNKCGIFPHTIISSMHCYTYQEAKLAAIDAALDYLEKGEAK